ncbi:MAG TPA: AraC family transcriptional regulator [Steroidobacteraceae bacterium]|nr:AraC family transcriptional regulator [Steroidobacteraceae bacterium]
MSERRAREAESVIFKAWPLPGIEAMRATTSRSFPRHTHDEYGIGLVDHGGHASWSGRGNVEAGPGTFISVNPGEVHDGHAMGGRARAWRILYFEPGVLSAWVRDVSGRDTVFEFSRPVFGDRALLPAFEAAFAQGEDPSAGMAREAAVLGLIAGLLTHSTAPRRSEARAVPDVSRARERLDADPAAPVTLDDLAQECSLSRYQLLRAFSRAFGLPPHAWLVQRRLARARQLLRAGTPLAEAAAAAGFSDQSHLTRCFARQFGVTPGRYARSIY